MAITMTPEDIEEAVTYLNTRKESILSEVDSLKGKIEELASSWEGTASQSFADSFTQSILPTLEKDFPSVIDGITTALTKTKDYFLEADDKASQALKIQ